MRIKVVMLTDGQNKIYYDQDGRLFIFANQEAAKKSSIPRRLLSVGARCEVRDAMFILGREGRLIMEQDRHCTIPWVPQSVDEAIFSAEQQTKEGEPCSTEHTD